MSSQSRVQHWYLSARTELLRRVAYRRARPLTVLDETLACFEGGEPFALDGVWPPDAKAEDLLLKPAGALLLQRRIPIAGLSSSMVERAVALNFTTWTGLRPDEVLWSAGAETIGDQQVTFIVISIIDRRMIERLRGAAARNGSRACYLDLGIGAPLSIRQRPAPWTSGQLVAATFASLIWLAAASSSWLTSRSSLEQAQARLTAAHAHIAEQGRLQARISGLQRQIAESDGRSGQRFSQALADASAAFGTAARLDELQWERGTLSLRLVTSDPDRLLVSGRDIADEGGIQQVGGLTATSDRNGDGFRVSLRYRARP